HLARPLRRRRAARHSAAVPHGPGLAAGHQARLRPAWRAPRGLQERTDRQAGAAHRVPDRRLMAGKVGILGLGIMGSAMAANLLRAGFTVIGYDPVAACRNRHRKAGGIVARSALDVAQATRILISSLPSTDALS